MTDLTKTPAEAEAVDLIKTVIPEPIKSPDEVVLGMVIKETITGLTGIAHQITWFLNGNIQFSIQPPGDGLEVKEGYAADWHTVAILDKGVSHLHTPGADFKFTFGDRVRDDFTGVEFHINRLIRFFNGCNYYDLVRKDKDGGIANEFLPEDRLVLVTPTKAPEKAPEAAPAKKTGGPMRRVPRAS